MKQTLRDIFARELARIEEASKTGALEMEDLKKVEILTRSLKQLEDPPRATSPLDDISNEDLLLLARLEAVHDTHVEPRQEPERAAPSRPKKGRRRAVEAGADTEDDS